MAAESSKEELVRLIKKFGAYLTVKMSNLFSISLRNLDSRSVGALAGFAVAMIFTWRLLRSPSGPQRRQPKRQAPAPSSSGVSSQSTTTLAPSGVCSSSEDSRAQNVIDEFFQPVKPTLGQIVRQKLSEGRKVTCRLLGVILEESSPEELQAKQATVRSSVPEVLLEITKFCDLYLMERVLDDESERKVFLALEDAGVFTSGDLVQGKVLFFVAQRMGGHPLFGNLNQIALSESNQKRTSKIAERSAGESTSACQGVNSSPSFDRGNSTLSDNSWKRKMIKCVWKVLCISAWNVYLRQDVVLSGVALALLYFTVLRFGTLMTVALQWEGIPAYVIGIARGISAATFVYPILQSYISTPKFSSLGF